LEYAKVVMAANALRIYHFCGLRHPPSHFKNPAKD
jgi:hypothetical protein